MTLADREYQRAHRNDAEFKKTHPKSRLWLWVAAVIIVLIAARLFWPPR